MLVSVIMPSYNLVKFISQAIESVLEQTYQSWEMLIVDDCSNDNSVELIKNYIKKDNRIKLIQLDKNSGPAIARNIAIEQAKGRYIAFLDADDLWKAEKLEKQINFMQDNHLSFTYSSYELIDEYGSGLGFFTTKKNISYKSMLKTCSVGCLTAIYDTKKLGKIYFKNLGHEDFILWLEILKEIGSTEGMLESLAFYRIIKNSVSSNKLKVAKYQWKIYRDVEKLNFFKSVYYFLNYTYLGYFKYKK